MTKPVHPPLLAILLFLSACATSPSTPHAALAHAGAALPSMIVSPTGPHPCDLLDIRELSSILGLDAATISLHAETIGNPVCSGSTPELDPYAEGSPVSFLYLDEMKNQDGFPNFAQALKQQLTRGSYTVAVGLDRGETVPVEAVEGIGDQALLYVTTSMATLIYQLDNKIRYTLTLYRRVPGRAMSTGLNMSQEELKTNVVAIAKAMQ